MRLPFALAVTAAGLPFAVGHSARRLSGSRVMKQRIDDGTLGGVTLAEANFSNERGLELTPDTWRWYLDKTPGGPLIQLGVHHADNLQYLLGPVAAVSGYQRKLFTKSEVPDATMTILEFESGALGYLGCGWASPGVYQIRLQGTKQNLMYDLDFTHWDEAHEADDMVLARQPGLRPARPHAGRPSADRHVPGAARGVRAGDPRAGDG